MGIDMSQQQKLFINFLVTCILMYITDLLWILSDMGVYHAPLSVTYIVNAAYFMSAGLLGYFWFLYAEQYLGIPILTNKKYLILGMIPILVLLVLVVGTYWTGWIFYFDENGGYQRGVLYMIQPLIFYGYIIYTTVRTCILAMKKENYARRGEYFTLISFLFYPFIAGTIQLAIPGLPLFCAGMTLASLKVYLGVQEQQISLDPLTRLNNRKQLNFYLTGKMKHWENSEKKLYLLMIDANGFKQINDRYGHVEGDKALLHIATALRDVGNNHDCFISRYGGDEFTIVYEAVQTGEVDALVADIHQSMSKVSAEMKLPYSLSLSIGYAEFVPEMMSVQELVHAADMKLYKMKDQKR